MSSVVSKIQNMYRLDRCISESEYFVRAKKVSITPVSYQKHEAYIEHGIHSSPIIRQTEKKEEEINRKKKKYSNVQKRKIQHGKGRVSPWARGNIASPRCSLQEHLPRLYPQSTFPDVQLDRDACVVKICFDDSWCKASNRQSNQ